MTTSARLTTGGLRLRVLLVAVLALLPAVGLRIYNSQVERNARRGDVLNDVLTLARFSTNEQARLIDGAGQLLLTLARLPEVRAQDLTGCNRLFADLLAQYTIYTNFGLADRDGQLICSGLPPKEPVSIADRSYFQGALQSGLLTGGEYQIGRVTGKPAINFGYPVFTETGEVFRVVFVALGVVSLNHLAVDAELPEGSTLTIIDRQGTLLARYPESPELVGKMFPEADIVRVILEKKVEGVAEAKGLDGINRLYAYSPLPGAGEAGEVYLYIGIPTSVAFADLNQAFRTNLIVLAAGMILALLAAWFIGNRLLVDYFAEQQRAEQAKDEFFSIASHELRTPLTAIRGNASMLEEYFGKKLKDPTVREIIQDIRKASSRLIELVNDFLDTGRLEQGRLKFQKEEFDIAALMEEATRELEPSALEKTVSLEIKPPSSPLPQVVADRNRVKQVLINLIGNAYKFTEKGGIIVAAEKEDAMIKVTVADTGKGIPQENQHLLFKKFQQTPIANGYTRDVTRGTGLGLYISKMMVEGMGGKIWLEKSEVGKGSTFAFTLPVAKG